MKGTTRQSTATSIVFGTPSAVEEQDGGTSSSPTRSKKQRGIKVLDLPNTSAKIMTFRLNDKSNETFQGKHRRPTPPRKTLVNASINVGKMIARKELFGVAQGTKDCVIERQACISHGAQENATIKATANENCTISTAENRPKVQRLCIPIDMLFINSVK